MMDTFLVKTVAKVSAARERLEEEDKKKRLISRKVCGISGFMQFSLNCLGTGRQSRVVSLSQGWDMLSQADLEERAEAVQRICGIIYLQ